MPRPKKCRHVTRMPRVRYFKPRGIPLTKLTEVYLTIEGAEALRLVDAAALNLNITAQQMNVPRHTLFRAEPATGIRFPKYRLCEAGKIVHEVVY